MINNENLEKMYNLVADRDKKILECWSEVDGTPSVTTIDMLTLMELEDTKENRLACVERFSGLREDSLINIFKSKKITLEKRKELLNKSLLFSTDYHLSLNKSLLQKVLSLDIDKIYKIVFNYNFLIGNIINKMNVEWEEIVLSYNDNLISREGSAEKAIEYLEKNNLFDLINGQRAEYCYSGIVLENGVDTVKSYAELFPREIISLNDEKKRFLKETNGMKSEIELSYIRYFTQLIVALSEKSPVLAISEWEKLDILWMDIDSPIQVVHPMEYYEDILRNSVTLEWDLRVTNPKVLKNTTGEKSLKVMVDYFDKHNYENEILFETVKNNIEKIQLHIGKQTLYSGMQYKGLSSAQVIPNNEQVSSEYGKKIFAFSDKGYELSKTKPLMEIHKQIFGPDIISKSKKLLDVQENWETIYDITTIGHEYGHILWKGVNTESKMSQTGVFKNIEEFKATAGGILSFFDSDIEEKYWEDVLINVLKRSVSLISWKEVTELVPYYCESLITMNILFDSGVFVFDGSNLSIDTSRKKYEDFKLEYSKVYFDLVSRYLKEEDAKVFLDEKSVLEDSFYYPKNENAYKFSKHYYNLYLEIGNNIS